MKMRCWASDFLQRRFKNGCFMHHIPLKWYIFFHYIQYYAHTLKEIQNSLGKSKLSTSCWQCDKLSPFFFSVWTPFSSLRPILCWSQSTYTCVEKSWCNLVPALELQMLYQRLWQLLGQLKSSFTRLWSLMHASCLSTVVTLLFCVLDTWKIKLNLSDLSQYMYKNMIA